MRKCGRKIEVTAIGPVPVVQRILRYLNCCLSAVAQNPSSHRGKPGGVQFRELEMLKTSLTLTLMLAVASVSFADDAKKDDGTKPAKKDKSVLKLFDGKTLKGWKPTEFGGEGEVRVKDGVLYLEVGSDLTGVTWQDPKKLPKTNYEITLEAMRVDGFDFFCGLTVPVKDSFCSLIIGGWGGGVCGISCVDGYDASENDTTTYREFKSKQWYKIKMRVTDTRIRAWIGKEEIVDQDIRDKKINVRIEVELSQPLGFASWQTTAGLRNIQVRKLSEKEIKAEAATQESE